MWVRFADLNREQQAVYMEWYRKRNKIVPLFASDLREKMISEEFEVDLNYYEEFEARYGRCGMRCSHK